MAAELTSYLRLLVCALVLFQPTSAAAQPALGESAIRQGRIADESNGAPTLGIRDGVFTVNGEKRFLLFFSYFAARRDAASQQRTILKTAKLHGFDGARVFPNWWRDNVAGPCDGGQYDQQPLMRGSGSIDPHAADNLRSLLTVAAEEGMLIQLALAYEPVNGLSFDRFKAGTADLARGLHGGYAHVFLDLQNEFNVAGAGSCKRAFTPAEVRQLRDAVKAVDPTRLVAASLANNITPADAWALHRETGADVLAFHDARTPSWAGQTDDHVRALRTASKDAVPIFFSEPFPQSQAPQSWGADVWLEAARLAKAAGAAAWCLHTEAYFYWSTTPPLSAVERGVVEQLRQSLESVTWPRER